MSNEKLSRLPVRVQLFIDVVLILLFFTLDARDVLFKTTWLGPHDSYSFHTQSNPLHIRPRPLELRSDTPTNRMDRLSGWGSFLRKCESLHALTSAGSDSFAHVLAERCVVGPRGSRQVVDELVLSSSVRVDSVAWAACKMLFHHRKPPICHSPIVRLFGHRYNMDDKPSLMTTELSTGAVRFADESVLATAYAAKPGSEAEAEIIELLSAIGTSTPISKTVCVEGFTPSDGPGYYTTSFIGCGSGTFNQSGFIGQFATNFQSLHQNKAWLTADMLHVSGMTYMVRENRRSVFVVRGSAKENTLEIVHQTQLNFSSFGVLYIVAILIDVFLLVLHVSSALQIARLMLWPVWKALAANNTTVVSRSNTKMAFAAEDCQAVLTSSLYRSKPVVVLIVVAGLLHWMLVVPCMIVVEEETASTRAKVHASLSTFRVWVFVLVAVHAVWDAFVAWFEQTAFVIVHGTYITIAEVATLTGIVGYLHRSSLLTLPSTKHRAQGQRQHDAATFVGFTAIANAYPEHLDSLQNTSSSVLSLLFAPLISVVLWSLLAIAGFVLLRYVYFQLRHPNLTMHHHNSRFLVNHTLARPSGKSMVVRPDLDATNDDDPKLTENTGNGSPRRPGSPKRQASEMAGSLMAASGSERELRLPLEKVVDIPIRARSLVRNGLKMEKKIGHQIFLRPPQYLEHGIILQSGCLKTRRGFLDIVHPYLRAAKHAMPSDESSHRSSSSGSSSPQRRTSSFDKLQDKRQPSVPLR